MNEFLLLGTGASMGIPVIGCICPVCTSSDPHNRRRRPAALLRVGDKQLLIDVGPDFREQALRCGISRLDGLILTHTHFDHIAGLDDLRIFNFKQKSALPCLLSKNSFAELEKRYSYLFEGQEERTVGVVHLDWNILSEDVGEVIFEGIPMRYFSYWQGDMRVTGYRFGDLAYVTDIRKFDQGVVDAVQGVKTLVVSALRESESKVHFNVEEAVNFSKMVGAEKTYFTHIAHEIDHTQLKLPEGVNLGFDGLKLELNL